MNGALTFVFYYCQVALVFAGTQLDAAFRAGLVGPVLAWLIAAAILIYFTHRARLMLQQAYATLCVQAYRAGRVGIRV